MISNQTREFLPLDVPPVTTVNGQRPANRVAATEQENAVRSRRGYTLDPGMTCEVTWEMFSYEFGTFESWWTYTLKNGLKPFWMQLPSPDGLEAWCLVRFVEPYEMVPAGFDQNTVTARLELRDRFVLATRPYTVPAPFTVANLDDDPLWANVAFAAPFETATQLDDVKNSFTPETVGGTVDLVDGVGEEPARHAYIHGDEAFVDYGANTEWDLRASFPGVAFCIECWIQNRGGEKDSVVWCMNTTEGEPEADPYARAYGLAVRRRQLYFWCADNASQTRYFEALLEDALVPATDWYHCFVQVRKGFLEIGVAPLGAVVGTVYTLAPFFYNLPIWPRFVLGKDDAQFLYDLMHYYTGKIEDLRITNIVRYD